MGLTNQSVGIQAVDSGLIIKKRHETDKIIAIAGNPNVGKSTVFNGLTNMKQHTGNWPGKTVCSAQGYCKTQRYSYVMVDIPGTYSLLAHSAEEEIARNFICFGDADAVVVVCDATCLERNLNLVLQTLEISNRVIVCVNLMDEAKRKQIQIDLRGLYGRLGVPVIGITARKKKTLKKLLEAVDLLMDTSAPASSSAAAQTSPAASERSFTSSITPPVPCFRIDYPPVIEEAISIVEPVVSELTELTEPAENRLNARWLSLKLLDYDASFICGLDTYFHFHLLENETLNAALKTAKELLREKGFAGNSLKDAIVSSLVHTAEELCSDTITYKKENYNAFDRKLDHILTSRIAGYPLMLLLLAFIFWLTIIGANYPSQLLASVLFRIQDELTVFFHALHAPEWLHEALVLGVYRVLSWVISVMLPPMAIFFPLFTLLEDSGLLPRIAYNLDKPFQCCHACGKQSLTMAMGFGCNAAGVVGCRIIDSPRERLIAILTNSFVPCNGRFPMLIALISMFFAGTDAGLKASVLSALTLTGVILFGVCMTFLSSFLLSKTVLKGIPSSFTLELPPYRKPQIGRVLIRSIFDRTLFVLGRAVFAAAPAGFLIWLLANVTIGSNTVLTCCCAFLDPVGRLMGLDGVILMAFILGLPANEIVIPIMLMSYLTQGSLLEPESLSAMKTIFLNHGWTPVTAICVILFSLMHSPCSTTLLTIRKETGSRKWTLFAFLLPVLSGFLICVLFSGSARLFLRIKPIAKILFH